MLIYINQNNGEKVNCLKTNQNMKNLNIAAPSQKTLLPRNQAKKPALYPAPIVNPRQVI